MIHPWTEKVLQAMRILDSIEEAEVTVNWPADLAGIDADGHHYEPANVVTITVKKERKADE